ncbi:unnamed protein product [Cuscuta epithymum]|uniref:Uncharacterized protein n=1 Tax=Cuscuta epithymum TaxID=186058 RepID=A0AAV0F868_9ASTE|nr:unnamed protein product [Cuscuta epithymum]
MSELVAMCVQEEERLKIEKPDVAYVTTTHQKKKGKYNITESSKIQQTNANAAFGSTAPKGPFRCKFCHQKGHSQRDYPKFKKWLEKKGNHLFMIYESFNIFSYKHMLDLFWFYGTCYKLLRGFHTIQRLERNQRTINVGNGDDLSIEALGTLQLVMRSGHCINLYDTL